VLEILVRLLVDAGPGIAWTAIFAAAVVATFVLYTGVALLATLRAHDPEQVKICYRVFRDLLGLFGRRGQR
jgi:hypothetical protein